LADFEHRKASADNRFPAPKVEETVLMRGQRRPRARQSTLSWPKNAQLHKLYQAIEVAEMLLRDGQSVHRHRLSALLDREVFSEPSRYSRHWRLR
jgi:hypothetical protein